MHVISSKEFATHQQKYFDLARKKELLVRDGKDTFQITLKTPQQREQKILPTDDDLHRAITAEELLKGIHADIRRKWASRK